MNIYQILPLNLVSGIRSFENINKSILPSNKEFLAIRLTSFDDDDIKKGRLPYITITITFP